MNRLLEVIYLGRCKDKGRGSQAFGWVNGEWKAIFPEDVLRAWFLDTAMPGELSSLYAILGVKATDEAEAIRAGYRRMALQWHPDRNRDPDAHNQFLRIQEAWEILSQPGKRARYDAGLALQASLTRASLTQASLTTNSHGQAAGTIIEGYRAPLKCGLVLCSVKDSGRWLVVDEIKAWTDITNARGQVLVSSWPMGAKEPVENWV